MEAAANMGSTIHDDIVRCSVGQSWIVPGSILDVEVPCLVDTGSRVTIITLSLLQQILKKPPKEHLVDTTSWLKLKAANGLENQSVLLKLLVLYIRGCQWSSV